MKSGKVYLVGAGPGDPGLITQKGLESLAQADVVIYDHLLDERLLGLAPQNAERIFAGKNASKHTIEQDEINRLLVEKAKNGKIVVRLKGGDPFVLGRGGEEGEVLADNLIPFEIVPGVSSAIAVPAYAGIPVTHRRLSSSFTVITGHEKPDKETSSIHWEKLAGGTDTLVFLMGMQNLADIVSKLVKYGRPAMTPVAVIKSGTQPEQTVVIGTLEDIVSKVEEKRLSAPAVIVVGEVVNLREKLRWFDNRPLSGKRILVTRARRQASELSRLLVECGAKPVEFPAIDIQPLSDNRDLDSAIADISGYQWIIFTSVNGVGPFFERLHFHHLDSRILKNIKIGVIGPATARALEQYGVIADFCPEVFSSRGLIVGLKDKNIAGQSFLLPRADIADKELTEGLTQLGAKIHGVAAYKTVPAANTSSVKRMLVAGKVDVVTFTSSSTVANLVTAFRKGHLPIDRFKSACIGPKTAESASRAGLKVDIIAREHTIKSLVEAIKQYFAEEKKNE